jgi:hypothetical protein
MRFHLVGMQTAGRACSLAETFPVRATPFKPPIDWLS